MKWMQSIVVFSKVGELQSFSRAGEVLGISKSYVSKLIRELEEEMGAQLFSRSTRKVVLTALGRDFLARCRDSMGELERTRREAHDLSRTVQGPLRVSVAGLFGEDYIAPLAIELSQKYPKLELELSFESRVVDLIAENFDVAIRFGALEDSSLVARKIASRREFICASHSYLERAGFARTPQDLANHNCLTTGVREWAFELGKKKLMVPISGNFKSNNPRTLLKAALMGAGIVRLPGSYVFNHIQEGELVSLLGEFAPPKSDIWVVTPYRKEMSVNVKVFTQALEHFFTEGHPNMLY